MADIDLGKQMGPLPLGAWIAVVGGGMGIAWYTRRSPGETVIVEDTSTDPGVGEGPGWIAYPPPTNAPPGAEPPSTNEEWGRLAINWLIAQGYDPGRSDNAIRKYLEASKLDTQEWALLQAALRQFGSPPVPLPNPPPVPTIPKPVDPTPKPTDPGPKPKPPPAAKPKLRYVTVGPWPVWNSTLWGIAKRYYGDGNQWRKIYSANWYKTTRPDGTKGWIKDPDLLIPYRKVYVP